MKVELYSTDGIALIIEAKTGVIYTQQCGGTACSHPEVEGYCVPYSSNQEWEDFGQATCEIGCCGGDLVGLKAELPMLRYGMNGQRVEIDRTRLDKATEAFVPVTAGELKGWIMLPDNCD